MSVKVILALGSNLGEKEDTLIRAIGDICSHEKIELKKISPMAITKAVGGPVNQPDFLNLVVEIETGLRPFELLRFCQSVEQKHHRVREIHWGPRTLDIDIVEYGNLMMDEPDLTLPHPSATERAFVLEPWARMDPTAELTGQPVSKLAKQAEDYHGIIEFREAPVMCA
ncbi:2-amino-4-hydroxy-6-hydroxymethyldihydropteridine diphosphokinase [uncultured Rothia sp.]|uniref:2-amino-4-hydroxy-6- hydroxymethyldihydropteridine diphosphokinase n=1 Tax=uncultured Rothia sp. TaxID=316088 RepID=UPI0032164EAF